MRVISETRLGMGIVVIPLLLVWDPWRMVVPLFKKEYQR